MTLMMRLRQSLFVCAFVALGLALTAQNAFASHFRYGTITWVLDTNNPSVATVTFNSSWRRSFFGAPVVGSVVGVGSIVITGPNGFSTTVPANVTVTSLNSTEDWISATQTFTVTLTGGNGNYLVDFTGSARLSTLLDNNHDQSWRVTSNITVRLPPLSVNQPPTVGTVPIIRIPSVGASTFQLPASDPNGDPVTFSFSPSNLSDLITTIPAGMTMTASGLVTYTPASAGMRAVQVKVTDPLGAYTVADFIVDAEPTTAPAPSLLINGQSTNQQITSVAGTPVAFTVTSSVSDNTVVTVSASGLPAGSTMTPSMPQSGVSTSSTFNWASPTVGTHIISFSSTSAAGRQTLNSMTLIVTSRPPTISCTTNIVGGVISAPNASGAPFSITANVDDPDHDPLTVAFFVDGVQRQVSGTLTPPNSSTFSTTLPLGSHTYEGRVGDGTGTTSCTGSFSVADTQAPSITVPGNQTLTATSASGAVANFTATATDNIDPSPIVSCSPASASTFPIGTSTVFCTAADASGNVSTGTFSINVNAPDLNVTSLTFETRPYFGATVGSTAQAISTWNSLPANVPGYAVNGPQSLTLFTQVSNQITFGGGMNNLGYHHHFAFNAPLDGPLTVRMGADFGRGGTLVIDGTTQLDFKGYDIWWNFAFSDPNQYLQGTIQVTAGPHTIDSYGFEDCCDGWQQAEYSYFGQPFKIFQAPANFVPVVALTGPANANMGSTQTYNFTVTDTDPGATFTVNAVSCGVGAVLVGSPSVNPGGGSFQCTFTAPGGTDVSVQATDNVGAQSNIGLINVAVSKLTTQTSVVLGPGSIQTYGQLQSVNLSVTNFNQGSAPGGSFLVSVDGGAGVSVPVVVNGQTPFGLGSLQPGPHTVSASYAGDANNAASSGSLTFTVNKADTIFNVQFPPPVTYATPQSVIVTFQTNGTQVPPTGTLTYQIDGGATLTAGINQNPTQATLPLGMLPAGLHNITISYAGDVHFNGFSNALAQALVNKATPQVQIQVGPPVTYPAHTSFTFTVIANTGSAPTGTVTYNVDGGTPHPATLIAVNTTQSAVTVDPGLISGGSHNVSVTYNGDSNFNQSGAGPFSFSINKASTQTQIASSPSPSIVGQLVTFTATIQPVVGGATPTGNITFKLDNNPAGPIVALDASGHASFTQTFGSVTNRTVQATYSGDTNYQGSSNSRSQSVIADPSTIVLTATPNPSTYGNPVTLSVSVSSQFVPASGFVSLRDTTLNPNAPVFTAIQLTVDPATGIGTGSAVIGGLFAVGTHTITGVYSGATNISGNITTTQLTVNPPAPPAFSQILPMPNGACICTPLTSIVQAIGTHNWFVKAGGSSLTLSVYTHALNSADPESVVATVFDSNGVQVGTVSASAPGGLNFGDEHSSSATIATNPGDVYRVDVTTPAPSTATQSAYRLKFFGAAEAGVASPLMNAVLGGADLTRWLVNVNAGEPLAVQFFPATLDPAQPSHATIQVFDTAAPTTPVALVDPSNPSGPSVTSITFNGTPAIFPIQFATAPGASSIYAVVVTNVNGDYRLARGSGADRAFYASWYTANNPGNLTINVDAGNSGFTGQVTITPTALSPGGTVDGALTLPVGSVTFKADVGSFHVVVTAPAGFTAVPSQIDIDSTCEKPTTIQISVFANTTTTIAAPPITFGADGLVTVNVSSPGGTVAGDVSLTVDGGAPLTQTLSGGSSTFTIPMPSAGDHTLSATYGAQGSLNPSGATGVLHVDQAASTTVVTCGPGVPYTGAAQTPCTVSVTGAGGLSLTPSANYSNNVNAGTATASYTFNGDANHTGSSDSKTFVIGKANATIGVTPYNVTYDAAAHTATGSATGVVGEALAGLDLTATTHTNAGASTDAWTFTDVTGNYNNAAGAVNDQINKATATISVTGYTVTFDGLSHTATGTAKGVSGESLAGLNLSGTTHTAAGTYNGDPWTFTDVTGNYLNAAGAVNDSIRFNVCLLYDPAKIAQSGSTIPIKVQLCDASGLNVSSASTVLHATGIQLIAGTTNGVLQDAGSANPDNDFRVVGPPASYMFNLSTKGFVTGTYNLMFTAGSDPTAYAVRFQVR